MKNSSIQHYTNSTKEHRVVYHWPFQRKPRLGPVGFHNARPPYTLPYDLVDDLTMISPDPTAWYVGHFVSYILRPNRSFQPIVNNIISNHIKVAIHVRRTDKKSEAKYQDTDKYMDLVQEYFDIQDKTEGYKVDRKLFVATDDPTVIKEIQMKYPGIAIECNNSAIETATKVQERYSADGVFGIVTDVFKLASADFLVCTYSSNVCRLAYELRMGSRPFILNQVGNVQIKIKIKHLHKYFRMRSSAWTTHGTPILKETPLQRLLKQSNIKTMMETTRPWHFKLVTSSDLML